MKDTYWAGDSLEVMRVFPESVRRNFGQEIRRLQRGEEPIDWKPMTTIGPGVREVRVQYRGQFRIFYVTNIGEKIVVLHAFKKKGTSHIKEGHKTGKEPVARSERATHEEDSAQN